MKRRGSTCQAEERACGRTGSHETPGPIGLVGSSERLEEKVRGRQKDKE